MKWTLISNESALVEEFHLTIKGDERLVVKINPLHQSVRLQFGLRRRLMFFEQRSVANSKFTLCDEYGMGIGDVIVDKRYNDRGSVTINNLKYLFQQQSTITSCRLIVYQDDVQRPLMTCELPTDAHPSFSHKKSKEADNLCLIVSACWYLSQQAVSTGQNEVFAMHY